MYKINHMYTTRGDPQLRRLLLYNFYYTTDFHTFHRIKFYLSLETL